MVEAQADYSVLLAEDEPIFSARVMTSMKDVQPTWTIYPYADGKGALRAIRETALPFRLALIDIGLPQASGLEVINAFHARFPDAAILVLSAISSEKTIFEAIQNGAQGYVLKQESLEEIKEAIRSVLRGEYPISPSLAGYLFKMVGPRKNAAQDTHLTPKETDLLRQLARGLTYAEAAEAMGVELSTVRTHIRNLYRKLNAHSQTQAVYEARERGLLK